MDIAVQEVESCKLSIRYIADAGEILEKRGQILDAFRKAPVPGFRAGKASIDAIKMYYRTQIEESLKRALAEDAYHNTLFEKKLRPHGAPRFNSLMLADGKFICEFDLFIKPNFSAPQFRGLEIPKPHQSTNEVELSEKMLQELRMKFGDVNPYTEEDFVQEGDNIIIDYEGSLNGTKLDIMTAQGEMLTVGKSQLPDFDKSLVGMKLGETREFDLLVPENSLPSLSGKTVHFAVTLNMGSKTTPCPLDDTLAAKMGKQTIAELREFVRGSATANISNSFRALVNDAVAHKLLELTDVEVPNWLILSEAKYLVHQAKVDWEKLEDLDKSKYMDMARKNVKLSLVLDKIREEEPEAQLTDQEVFDIIKNNLLKFSKVDDIQKTMEEMHKSGYISILFSRIKDEYTLDFVVKNVRIIE